MYREYVTSILLIISIVLFLFGQLYAQEEEGEIIIISERVGKEIDQAERDKFKLFQGIKGFQSAVYIKLPDGRYFLKINYLDDKTGEPKISHTLQSEASIKNRGYYIDHFEEIQAEKQQSQNLSKPQTVSSDSGEIKAHQDTVYQKPGTAFFVELIGKPYPSINIDFRINKWSRFGLGIMAYYEIEDEEKGEDEVNSFVPNIMCYLLGGEKKSKFEIGAGVGVLPVWHKDVTKGSPLIYFGVIGYRYQKKNGLLFRIGLNLCVAPEITLPIPGISFGYSL